MLKYDLMRGMSEDPFLGGGGQELFYQVVVVGKEDHSWEELSEKVPALPRGWYELAHLPQEDRIEFTRTFWLSKLPFISPKIVEAIESFFSELETIEIYLTQVEPNQPFEVHMIYALQLDTGFFQGGVPASKEEIAILSNQFGHLTFPQDYLAFLAIHNGFCKYTDTGMVKVQEMPRVYHHFQELLSEKELIRPDGNVIEPKQLIPFYESFGLHCYQCFYVDWYIESEMGNVYFSEHDYAISNFLDSTRLEENLAFPNFLSWLIFYLEDIWHL